MPPRRKSAINSPLPLDYMLAVMADETVPAERRDEMARLAAPYLHAKADAKTRRKIKAMESDESRDDANPIIRTARTTLDGKLARLAAAAPAKPATGEP